MNNLLINPPGYSYVRPMNSEYSIGLLKLSTYLKSKGENVEYFDFVPNKEFFSCFNVLNNGSDFRTFKYYSSDIDQLKCYKSQEYPLDRSSFIRNTGEYVTRFGDIFSRIYSGVDRSVFIDYLKKNKPDRIWISSGITYHYKGTVDLINWCKDIYPDVEVNLGGIYPTLCYDDAVKNTKADTIFVGENPEFKDMMMDYEVLPNKPEYIVRQFSKGCPNSCKFCAVSHLDGRKVRVVDIDKDIQEIDYLTTKYNTNRIKLWGSNMLLPGKGKCFEEWLDKLIALDKKFEISCPEGFAPELLTDSICKKIHKAGFLYIEIPLESGTDESLSGEMGKKYNIETWEKAVSYAWNAGYDKHQIHVAMIYAAVNQNWKDLLEAVKLITKHNLRAVGRPYVPVPKSEWYEESDRFKSMDLELLDGALYPAIEDINLYKEMKMLSSYLIDNMSCEINDRRVEFLKEIEGDNTMINGEVIDKMAVLLIDIAQQNEAILAGMEELKSLKKRVEDLENGEKSEA